MMEVSEMKNMKKKTILMLATMVLLLTVTVGSTIAYLVTSSGPVENKFAPSRVASEVVETFTPGTATKQDVKIKNAGDTSAYIRAAIVITWKDKDGYTMPEVPVAGTDYTIEINETAWTLSKGFYYYKEAVAPGASTKNLIEKCESIGNYTDGRALCVEVIGSAIQSEGMDATSAQDAFNKAASGK